MLHFRKTVKQKIYIKKTIKNWLEFFKNNNIKIKLDVVKEAIIDYRSDGKKLMRKLAEKYGLDIENVNLEKPNRTSEFETLSKKAYEYLIEQQKNVEETYGIHNYENWFYHQGTGILTFSNLENQTEIIEIQYEEVGSISKISKTWLWSWANPHLDSKIKTDIEIVKNYGEENNLESLTKRKWFGDEYDGWEMTAIAAYLMKAKGAYRLPLENTFSFVIYKEMNDKR